MSFNLINVGIADIEIARAPDILRTILGSCVGICLYDNKNRIGGLAHIMLPRIHDRDSNIKKFADTAIPYLLNEMVKAGAGRKDIKAKIIGGATMFKIATKNLASNIGKNNIEAVKQILNDLNIAITAQDLGGDLGRTIDFYLETGKIKIKTSASHVKII